MRICWCSNADLIPFGPEYGKCRACGTLVLIKSIHPEQLQVFNDESDFYGKKYWLNHQNKDFGYPDIYARVRNDLTERNLYWLKTLLKYRLPPAKVMELGCAHGSFVALLRQAGYNASGLEMSPWIVEFGQKTFGVPIFIGPVETLDLPACSLDVIALMDVLEHLPDPSATMAHCMRLLKPAGLLLVQTPQFNEGMNFSALMETKGAFLEQLKADEHIYLFSNRSVAQLFQQIGAEYIQFEPAIFGHYDMFFAVSRMPLETRNTDEIESALLATPNGRMALALLDIYQRESTTVAQFVVQLQTIEADRAARLEVINQQAWQLNSTEAELNSTKAELNSTKAELNSTKAELANIYGSYTWITVSISRKILTKLIPEGSVRRKIAVILWRFVLLFLRLFVRETRKIKSGIFLCKNYFMKFKPRKKRKINKNSKKIVYIGHSYHNKTKSTVFLIEYLKQFYDVEEILDESWLGKPFPDLSFVDEHYLGVIFFQNLPSTEILQSIKNGNLIFFPMYDSVGYDYAFWSGYRNFKIMNFSKTLHTKLLEWGFESMFVQYFPKPDEFIPGNKNEVFFWQRLSKINIQTILKLFGKDELKIHIHKTIDPDQKFIQPNKEDEDKFQITYSDWFDTREDLWGVIKQKGIYVAPREYEGIGLSFLEAMARGKAVVAVDNPTMNEYIVHNKTGYLFNLKKPKKIELANIEEVQKHTYKYIHEGYKKWEKDKIKIIEFIKKP